MTVGDFLSGLGDVINQQFSTGDNKLRSLDIVKDGIVQPYRRLGEYADRFDQSAERSYVEEGFVQTNLHNPKPNNLEILLQEPDLTILVKKRAFSSLSENYRLDLMDQEEQKFIRATKFLFQNKCKQIAAYERLTKIQTVVTELGSVDYHLLPIIFSATDALGGVLGGSPGFQKFKSVIDRVRTVTNLSDTQNTTTWVTNVLNGKTDLGTGTGVIEFTTATSVNTTTSIHFGSGSFDMSFVDPHGLMRITHNDIEQAIADAVNWVTGSSFIQLSLDTLSKGLEQDKKELNRLRTARHANPINFIVNPDTFLGSRVRAIIDGSGIEIKFSGSVAGARIDPAYLRGGPIAGQDGVDTNRHTSTDITIKSNIIDLEFNTKNLHKAKDVIGDMENSFNTGKGKGDPGSEFAVFGRIVRGLYNQMQINKNSKTTAVAYNVANNKLRKKLRLHYGGKLIIQPMDVVHIFVSSKTKLDPKVLGGLQDFFGETGILQTTNKALMSLQDFFSAGQDNSIEKTLFVGKDFPNWLWLLLRNKFTTDKSGTQIFAGLVESSSESYNNGSYIVRALGKDMATFFKFGVVNYQPAVDVWNGSLYDPLTPFNIEFDSVTGVRKDKTPELLPENSAFFNSVFLKYKSGPLTGRKPSDNNFVQDTAQYKNTAVRQVYYDPDGMVYKWKEGIGALVMSGNNFDDNPTNRTPVPPQTQDPFAGQDVMNALSLLITGEPYNFATFYKAASEFGGYGRDPVTGQDPATSYFRNLQADVKKRNLLYGNFVPFKRLTMDTETYKNVLNNQIRASGLDRELQDLLAQKAALSDRILYLTNLGRATNNTNAPDETKKLAELNEKINAKTQAINAELNQITQPISIIGDDITLDFNPFTANNSKNNLSGIERYNKDLRRRSHYLTRRLSWKVRANEDANFFIVDDAYDKDYDIQAFEKAGHNASTFKSEYINVADKIVNIAKNLDLEIFANTQGHIEIRPPKYNLVPSSVFYRMIRLKEEFGIQIYPQILEDLFTNQVDNTLTRVAILEDEIRMYGLALGFNDDRTIERFLSVQAPIGGNHLGTATFTFISDSNGQIDNLLLSKKSKNLDTAEATATFEQALKDLKSVETQSTINAILSTNTRNLLLDNAVPRDTSLNALLSKKTTLARQTEINARLQQSTGHTFDLQQLFPNSAKLLSKEGISSQDTLKILNEIAVRIGERQRLLKVANAALKNAVESLVAFKTNAIGKRLTNPNLLNSSTIPSVFEGMIEDESYDDYGPGSGHRYVIKNHHVKSMSITETAPQFTAIEVHGKFADNFPTNLPQDLNGFTGGGNALTSAVAVDYDLWRMYGIKIPQSIEAPFLKQPETQGAPFAVAVLNKARKEIFSGSITIVGNEFMQPGEVVYVEHQDMLYYVESVQQSFSYGREFSTTLQVAYGHMPGEYIPTYLDTVGKALYRNRDISNYVSMRQGTNNSETHLGTLIGVANNNLSALDSLMSDSLVSADNQASLRDILLTANAAFNSAGSNYKATLELRIYFSSHSAFDGPHTHAQDLTELVQGFLLGTQDLFNGPLIKIPKPTNFLKNKASIKPKEVDSDQVGEFRSPSSQAYSLAKRVAQRNGQFGKATDISTIDKIINSSVVDCWMLFEQL